MLLFHFQTTFFKVWRRTDGIQTLDNRQSNEIDYARYYTSCTVVDPGFPVGGVDLVGGRGLPGRLRFENFVWLST